MGWLYLRCILSSFSPQPHPHEQCKFTDRSNYCSNSIDTACRKSKPWCYTMDPKMAWELCDIPECGGELTINVSCHLIYYVLTYWIDAYSHIQYIGSDLSQVFRCKGPTWGLYLSGIATLPGHVNKCTTEVSFCCIPSLIHSNLACW